MLFVPVGYIFTSTVSLLAINVGGIKYFTSVVTSIKIRWRHKYNDFNVLPIKSWISWFDFMHLMLPWFYFKRLCYLDFAELWKPSLLNILYKLSIRIKSRIIDHEKNNFMSVVKVKMQWSIICHKYYTVLILCIKRA